MDNAIVRFLLLIIFSVTAMMIAANPKPDLAKIEAIPAVQKVQAEELPPEPQKPVKPAQKKPQKPKPRKIVDNTPKADPTAPAQVIRSGAQSCNNFLHLLRKYNWPINTMLQIMDAETAGSVNGMCDPTASNMEPHYVNGSVYCYGSHGLFQVSCHDGIVKDPARNVEIAYQKYRSQGFRAWPYTCKVKVRCQ